MTPKCPDCKRDQDDCCCKDEIESLHQQLAAEQAKNAGLRGELSRLCECLNKNGYSTNASKEILSLPSDTSALASYVAKAGEKMREECANVCESRTVLDADNGGGAASCETEIRALPGVTLEDLK